jgi:uncharacterized protein (TIGR02246 family)
MRKRARLFPTPEDAENAFYEAFERGDVAAMMAVWAETDEIVCIHPNGPRLAGFDTVRESWVRIFAGGMQLRVRTADVRAFRGQTVAVHTVIERVAPPGENSPITEMFATNVYELTEGGWRMVVHHAVTAPAAEAPVEEEEPEAASHTLH